MSKKAHSVGLERTLLKGNAMNERHRLLASLLFLVGVTFADSASAQDAPAGYQSVPPPPTAQVPPPGPRYEAEVIENRARNTVFAEGLGAGLFYSINYERLVHEDVGLRLGVGFLGLDGYDPDDGVSVRATLTTLPLTVSYLGIGSTNHIFEVGGGATLMIVTAAVNDGVVSRGSGVGAFGTAFVGYRYHPSEPAGFHFRGGVMAVMARGLSFSSSDPDRFGAIPWPYVGAGASF
ncbi:MAG: hypothetical protein CMN30_06240 [Sandaracinus sp.]|nr:hypothetical protein [Sandaracinus sp.]